MQSERFLLQERNCRPGFMFTHHKFAIPSRETKELLKGVSSDTRQRLEDERMSRRTVQWAPEEESESSKLKPRGDRVRPSLKVVRELAVYSDIEYCSPLYETHGWKEYPKVLETLSL